MAEEEGLKGALGKKCVSFVGRCADSKIPHAYVTGFDEKFEKIWK